MDEQVAQFMQLTECSSLDTAKHYLEACGSQLDQAIELYFNSQAQDAPANPAVASQATGEASAGDGLAAPNEDVVRAPMPAKFDRLQDPLTYRSNKHNRPVTVDAFRDFKEEREVAEGRKGVDELKGLSGMFKPPIEIQCGGNFDSAKARAQGQNRWLIVNIQQPSEFASHQLNRDTWSHESLQQVIQGSFVFWQATYGHDEGDKVCAFYNLAIDMLPVVIIIDPITGQAMRTWHGFVDPVNLIEVLINFMETDPTHPRASKLMQNSEQIEMMKQHRASSSSAPQPPPANQGATSTEQQAKVQQQVDQKCTNQSQGQSTKGEGDGVASGQQEAAEENKAVVQYHDIPDEPGANEPSIRVAIRLTSGERVVRRFHTDALIQQLYWYVENINKVPSDTFVLLPSIPGSQPLVNKQDTMSSAGLDGALLNMQTC